MKLLSEPSRAAAVECPYLPERSFSQDYFFAMDLDDHEFGVLLAAGWRRFGTFFFRPACSGCQLCIPLRVDVETFTMRRSHRRILSRGAAVEMTAKSLEANDEAWEVYSAHSRARFARVENRAVFEKTFFDNAVPALQTEYRLDGKLIGLGFLDIGDSGLSSVYFAFHPHWARYSPGTLSILREIELVRQKGLGWYYLGYWVPGCDSMEYKARFGPHQLFNWEKQEWQNSEKHPFFSGESTDAMGREA